MRLSGAAHAHLRLPARGPAGALARPADPRAASICCGRGSSRCSVAAGSWRAWLAFEQARKHVPAYRAFLEEHGGGEVVLHGLRPDFSAIPITDKENYVKRWSVEERCRGGRIPLRGVVVDESSGTSGEPSNWVRGSEERADGRRTAAVGAPQDVRPRMASS